jgi:hypothetical protein
MQEVVASIELAIRLGKRETDLRHTKAGVNFHREKNEYMWMGNYQFIAVLQRKQKELDNIRGSIKYAVQHYGIWTIEAHHSGLEIHLNFEIDQI